MPYAWLISDVTNMQVGESRNHPHNWPGVNNTMVGQAQAALDTIQGKTFKVTKTSYDREHWLSLKVTRLS